MKLSVILCTHNPRPGFLDRTLASLRAQSLPPGDWELLIIDNASSESVSSRISLGWHPHARVVVEPELGLTPARLCGIAEASTDILVWVDDDNVLAPEYLAVAIDLAQTWPQLGAWGCGHFEPEWETPPAPELRPYLEYLAVGQRSADRWSNRPFDYEAMPAGAGLCCRLTVARRYATSVRSDARRRQLGRTGDGLGACEDFDLALNAIDLGLGTGTFPRLRLTHLMPSERVREDYLLRLVEGHARSIVLLMALRDPNFRPPAPNWKTRLRQYRLRRTLSPVARRISDARLRGEQAAYRVLMATEDFRVSAITHANS